VPDPLDAVREAERLVREATRRAEAMAGEGAEPSPPPRGWDVPGEERPAASPFGDLAALTGLLELARGAVPPELARQLAQALRELLIALRAILDYSIERLEPAQRAPVQVEDIPVE
jgi:hypothetical protein